MKNAVIEVRDVKRSFRSAKKGEGLKGAFELLLRPQYSTHEALKGVSFTIEEGSFVGLIGANGAGKTTLLKILSGLIPPTSGEARVLGHVPFSRPLEFRHQISLVMGQKAQLWWDLPAIDAFDLLRAIYDIPEKVYRERMQTLAELLDVTKHLQTQIRRLSLGERMKMELIGALLHWPKVIFLDEPTIGLDVIAAQKLREFLKVFNQREKATIILTSHNMEDIERLCSRVLIIRTGDLIFDGSPNTLTRRGEQQLRVRLASPMTTSEVSALTGLPESTVRIGNDPEAGDDEAADEAESLATVRITLQREQISGVLHSIMSRTQVVDMGIEEQSLEAVIGRIYENGLGTTPSAGDSVVNVGWRWAALKNGFQDATAYRVEFFFEILGSMAVPALIQWVLWYALFKIGGAETVAGMTYSDMVAYTLTSLLFTQIRGGDHDFELAEMVREGSLSNYLLRPLSVVEFIYIRGFAPKLFIASVALGIGLVVGTYFGMNPGRLLGAMLLALLGNVIHYQFGACLATTAFYWEEAYAVMMVKNMVVQILCGELIPLNMFPENMQWIWKSTPFYLYVYGPTQYALGRWTHEQYLTSLGIAGLWMIGFYFLIRITWGIGIKRYQSLGG